MFRAFEPGQGLLLPPSLDDWLPAEHLARFIAELVGEHLDLSRIWAAYTEGRGGPPYDPRLMVRILLYGYTIGVRSSRAIEVKCTDDVAFRWLAAGAAPDYRAIARFRKRHLSALGHLFVQALALCQAAGMVRLGRVALDGTKVRANASKRKAMSYARMSEKEKVLAGQVSALLAEAERIDKAEDVRYGKNNRGDELPEALRRRETRLGKIREAKAALEQEAAAGMSDHSGQVKPQSCVGVAFTGEHDVYATADPAAIKIQIFGEQYGGSGRNAAPYYVEQTAAVFSSAAEAQQILKSSQDQWNTCSSTEVDVTLGYENGRGFRLGDVKHEGDLITIRMASADGLTGLHACQQAFGVRANVVVEARTCEEPSVPNFNWGDPANPAWATPTAAPLANAMLDKVKI